MYELPERENEWIEKMLEYNTKGAEDDARPDGG